MKLYSFIAIILMSVGTAFALYGLYLFDGRTVGIMSLSFASTLGPAFALIKRRNECKKEIVFK